ncbi:MAG: tyrosine-type recombinase/integrase [Rhizobiales bacterium]|nr:tyrosine-type recombinase/integrase [Hyphomicrobiales bacterium]
MFFVRYRVAGRQRYVTIGRFGPLTVADARKAAVRLLGQVAEGRDPADERDDARHQLDVAAASKIFLEQHVSKLRPVTQAEYARLFTKTILPEFGRQKVAAVTHAQVAAWHAALGNTPRTANMNFSLLRKFFNWSMQQGLRAKGDNPCGGVRQFRENRRERYLTEEEFQRLGAVLADFEETRRIRPQAIAAIRLLIFTGCRLSEILTLQWQHVDLDRGRLLLPETKTGRKAIILNAPALAVLEAQTRIAGSPYVLVSPVDPMRPYVNLQKPWRLVCSVAGLDDVRLHDLRHSFASVAAQRGASLPMIGRLLGHTQVQTTARYAHLADATVELLNEQVGEQLARALGNRET